ncbi:Gnk2-homologous domain [Sesbania bispinosa]|nr:Gnk2-homologous domain [Sesbania bispinosa]
MKMLLPTITSMRFLTFILLFLITPTIEQSPIYMYNSCQNTTGKSLPTSYQTNVNNLLTWITSDSAKGNKFSHTTVGNDNGDDVVYGSYDCRGDITGYFCQFCLNTAAREIVQRCPNSASAVIWYDICIIRYSNQSFLGKLSLTPP